MLQTNAPALSQFTRGPSSLQEVPVPANTANGAEIEDKPAEGTVTFKMQRLEGTMNQRSGSVVLQLITDC
jgi:hypothetical protein